MTSLCPPPSPSLCPAPLPIVGSRALLGPLGTCLPSLAAACHRRRVTSGHITGIVLFVGRRFTSGDDIHQPHSGDAPYGHIISEKSAELQRDTFFFAHMGGFPICLALGLNQQITPVTRRLPETRHRDTAANVHQVRHIPGRRRCVLTDSDRKTGTVI
ncbi:hypothetical protein B0H10DRAFT_1960691 [Mycena sp. CBHHK59/15]|nr:hypothetical protein B0H10DRAFT_1960691 [Mycena sp. CBHHK59/15]